MDKTLDFTNYIGKQLSILNTKSSLVLSNLKRGSYKEIVLSIVPLKSAIDTPIAESQGVPITPNPYAGVFFNYCKGIVITNKYVYYFSQVGKIDIEIVIVGHLAYKIEGNLWVKQ